MFTNKYDGDYVRLYAHQGGAKILLVHEWTKELRKLLRKYSSVTYEKWAHGAQLGAWRHYAATILKILIR